MKKRVHLLMLAVLSIVTLMTSSCDFDYFCEDATGDFAEKAVQLGEITDVSLNIGATVHIKQGSEEGVVIKGKEDAINNLDLDVVSNLWEIDFIDGRCMRNHDLVIEITVQDLNSLKIAGSGSIFATEDTLQLDDELTTNISGSGRIDILANGPSIENHISGSGTLNLTGNMTENEIHVSGSGRIRAFDLWTLNSKITISGSGNAEVWVDGGTLDAKISGSGNVSYVGIPNSVLVDITGSGELIDAN